MWGALDHLIWNDPEGNSNALQGCGVGGNFGYLESESANNAPTPIKFRLELKKHTKRRRQQLLPNYLSLLEELRRTWWNSFLDSTVSVYIYFKTCMPACQYEGRHVYMFLEETVYPRFVSVVLQECMNVYV